MIADSLKAAALVFVLAAAHVGIFGGELLDRADRVVGWVALGGVLALVDRRRS